jgi:SSS family solute:Na+ symporter
VAIILFGLAALGFSIVSSDELVLLARVSFNGTALLAPLVLAGVLGDHTPGPEVVAAPALGLALFLASLLGLIPDTVGPARLDLLLLVGIALVTGGSILYRTATSHEQAAS